MRTPNNFTAEELIEYIAKMKNLSSEEIQKICSEWLRQNVMDDWLC